MKEKLALRDMIEISAYLDGRLDPAARQRLEARLREDTTFNQVFLEIQHTRSLLRSLPAKRAPRNFTLSAQVAGRRARRWGVHSYFGLASATAALALVLVAGITLFAPRASLKAAPPPAAMLQAESPMQDNAAEAAPAMPVPQAAPEATATPLIFNWNPQGQAVGMGGGGSDAAASAPKALGGGGVATAPDAGTFEAMTGESAAAVQEAPEGAAGESSTPDPSTLILGLPQPGAEGEAVSRDMSDSSRAVSTLPASAIWMIGLGAVTLIFAGLALFLRRR